METFIAKFSNAAEYNGWSEDDCLANMKASLTGGAANVLWDTPKSKHDSFEKLIQVLTTRFGNEGMSERFRCELRTRRRRPGESLQSLHQDIQRLASLAFQGPRTEAVEVLARDAFIDALDDSEFTLKIREREPLTLDDAVRLATRLESYRRAERAGTDDKGEKAQVRATSSENKQPEFQRLDAIEKQLMLLRDQLALLNNKPVTSQVVPAKPDKDLPTVQTPSQRGRKGLYVFRAEVSDILHVNVPTGHRNLLINGKGDLHSR